MNTYLVGGAVRDQLLNRPVVDRDWVVVGATPDELIQRGFKPVGKDFPVFLNPQTHEEYALARTEKKQGKGYHGFSCYFAPDVTLEQDLERRDLTINAIAQSEDGTLVDPFNGVADLQAKVLRHVSAAFIEDPLRVLRVARFAARYHSLGFTIAEETLQLMRQLAASGELNHLTPERVWKETEKALSENSPQVYFQTLHQVDALACIFPELDRLWGIPNPPQWHPEIDSGIHTMMVLEQAAKLSSSIDVRFAALCHDLGKGLTPEHEWPSHKGHEVAGIKVIEKMCQRLRIPNKLKQLACVTSEYHLHCHRAFELNPKTLIKTLESTGAYRQENAFEQFLLACKADFLGRTGFEDKPYPQLEFLSQLREKTATIDAKPFIDEGYTGKKIGEQIYRKRVDIATSFRASFSDETRA
ncbi:multifunctional CCA addition/repair protein [Pleionea litopenaei]|uniref:Multifunctional CCA protein n=1 Tax=Pleionea litopenaei TaxID=3070815 RepID=A0AA51RQ47_9GAMM|nr:multifunctional CCA addition/repair protein [Pleionea sp. HL-JVS1]WMS85572.1 multifunctional CCA addition/repair protein [Pleionea sp. HL-JVS1]